MCRVVSLGEVLEVEMGIDLRGGNALVPQQLLHRTQVTGRLQQMTRKAVPQHMRVYMHAEPAALRPQRQALLDHAASRNTMILANSIYGCLQGPRLPTRAEIRRYRNDGVDIIGMTGMPEAILAKELELDYVHLCGVIGQNDGHQHSPDFRSRQAHIAIQKIQQLLVDM